MRERNERESERNEEKLFFSSCHEKKSLTRNGENLRRPTTTTTTRANASQIYLLCLPLFVCVM